MMYNKIMNGSLAMQINKKILIEEPGNVFSWRDFSKQNIKSKTVEQNLIRLKKKHLIESVANFRGLYYKPKTNPLIGVLPPSENEILKAYEKKLGTHFYVSGATAANILGLSTQIPSKAVYYTNKQLKPLFIGKKEISFKRKKLDYSHKQNKSLLLLLAMEYLGKNEVNNESTKEKIKSIILNKNELMDFKNNLNNFPKWISKFIEAHID